MTPPPWSDLLFVQLGWGRDRVRTLGELSESMGAPRRALEQASEELRRSGCPLISCSQGLYLSTDQRELEAAAKSLQARAVTILLGSRALRRTARLYAKNRQLVMDL